MTMWTYNTFEEKSAMNILYNSPLKKKYNTIYETNFIIKSL